MRAELRSRTEADAAVWARESWPGDDRPTLADVIDDRPTAAEITRRFIEAEQARIAAGIPTPPDPWHAHLDRMNAAADARHRARTERRAAG